MGYDALASGSTVYAYVGGNPVNNIDPSGELFGPPPPPIVLPVAPPPVVLPFTPPLVVPSPVAPPIPPIVVPVVAVATAAAVGYGIGTWIYHHNAVAIQDTVEHFFPYSLPTGPSLQHIYCESEDDDNECDQIKHEEIDECFEQNEMWQDTPKSWMLGACLNRAHERWRACERNGGSMPPEAPDPWTDPDVDGYPTIHDK